MDVKILDPSLKRFSKVFRRLLWVESSHGSVFKSLPLNL